MRNAWLVAKRDLGSFFSSPMFYVVTTVFLVLYSFIFFNILNFFSFQSLQASQIQAAGIILNVNQMVVEPSFHNMAVTLLLMVPIITMRSFAEEKKNRTMTLLLSSPIHLKEIILGKFFACLGVVLVMVAISSYSILYLFKVGSPEVGPILSGYLGILLISGCYISMGIFASSLTDNQVIAAVLSFGLALFMWVIGWAAQATGPGFGQVLQFLSLIEHMDSMVKGVINTSDLTYYLSFIFFGLFLTHRILDSQRWS